MLKKFLFYYLYDFRPPYDAAGMLVKIFKGIPQLLLLRELDVNKKKKSQCSLRCVLYARFGGIWIGNSALAILKLALLFLQCLYRKLNYKAFVM